MYVREQLDKDLYPAQLGTEAYLLTKTTQHYHNKLTVVSCVISRLWRLINIHVLSVMNIIIASSSGGRWETSHNNRHLTQMRPREKQQLLPKHEYKQPNSSKVKDPDIYTVSQKRDPDIIDCNFGKD